MSQLMISSGSNCEIDIFSSFFHSLKSFLEFLEASTTHRLWPRMLATVSTGSRKPGPLSHEDQVHQLLSHRNTYGNGYGSTQIRHNFRIWSPEKGFLLSMHRSPRTNVSCVCVRLFEPSAQMAFVATVRSLPPSRDRDLKHKANL